MRFSPFRVLAAGAVALAFVCGLEAAAPVRTVVFATGSEVPDAGAPQTGVPAEAVFVSFSGYVEDGAGNSAFLGRWSSPGGRGAGIFHNGSPIAVTGGSAPTGVDDGAKFSSFGQPLLSTEGVAFSARLAGAKVNPRLINSIWSNTRGALQAHLSRTDAPPDVPGGRIDKVLSFSLRGDELLALVQYQVGAGGVTLGERTALIVSSPTRYETLLRTQRNITLPTGEVGVTKIGVFQPAPLSPGHDRSHARGVAAVQIGLNNGTTIAAVVLGPDQVRTIASAASGSGFTGFGNPTVGAENVAAVRVVRRHNVSTGAANDEALLDGDAELGLNPVVSEGDSVATSLKLGTFGDPIVNEQGAYAFDGRLVGVNLTTQNNRALFFGGESAAAMVARLGDLAPDAEGETRFDVRYKAFLALGLPDGAAAAPLWLAQLAGPNVGASNNLGLFAQDDTGVRRRLLRNGDTLTIGATTKTIATFTALAGGTFPVGGRRVYGEAGTIGALVSFVGGGQALLRVSY